MNSLRPLVTITTLVVVGAFLYVKLNEGPPRQAPAATEAWPYQPAVDVPPLDARAGTATADGAGAAPPAWPAVTADATASPIAESTIPVAPQPFEPSPPVIAPNATPSEAATVVAISPAVPAMPAMPELPELSPQTSPQANPAVEIPTQLPANIPTAQYPDQQAGTEQPAPAAVTASAEPLAPAAPTVTQPPATPVAPSEVPLTPESANAASAATMNLETPPLASQSNPLRSVAQPEAPVDRYAASSATPSVPPDAAAITPIEPNFAASWPAIQAALTRGDLAAAHQQLSRWYHDPSLTPTDAERVETLLSQLAGTVVYSTEHRLEPPHVVKQGETLETIAQQYTVPWQLLAKINNVSTPDTVRPGQELKVVRGPFAAIVELDRKELVLMLDGRYAGKFSVAPGSAAVNEGEWHVSKRTAGNLVLISNKGANDGPASALIIGGDPKALAADFSQVGQNGQIEKLAVTELIVSASDAQELADILSIGSSVVIRR